jgi:2-phosphosulfolactate phosphatase
MQGMARLKRDLVSLRRLPARMTAATPTILAHRQFCRIPQSRFANWQYPDRIRPMQTTLEVLFTLAESEALKNRDLSKTDCVVFDVLRATTSMLTALQNGATRIHPVKEISEALALKRDLGEPALLAGERDGLRIRAGQAGGVDFDLGNSPREFTPARVAGRSIIITTTNGTCALQACRGARHILAGAFLNIAALARWLKEQSPSNLLLVGAGTFEQAAYEDILAAGALCELIWDQFTHHADSAQIAREIYRVGATDLAAALQQHSRNARRLLARPELRDDVPFALQRDTVSFVAELKDGAALEKLQF